MIVKIIKNDIVKLFLTNEYDYMVHGCNCFCTMGAGIAKHIAMNFPEAIEADLNTKKGDINKLGTYSSAITKYGIIINAYTQYNYGKGLMVDYGAIENCFRKLNRELIPGSKVLIPKLGSGLGGGEWKIIKSLIDSNTDNLNITLTTL